VALKSCGKGLMGLRYPYEIRDEKDYFDSIPDEKIPKDMLGLVAHIVETKAGDFQPSKFEISTRMPLGSSETEAARREDSKLNGAIAAGQ